ncbi:MAG: hypothetical protein KGV59_07370 [Tenacibaculum sp.]|nr:hypothetical protein [Tenacibaculum sp.]
MNAEKQTVDLLLKRGVEVRIKAPLFLRIFRRNKNMVVQLPRVDVLLEIANLWLTINQKADKELSLTDAFTLVKDHTKTISKIVAWCVVNNPKKAWQVGFVAKKLRKLSAEDLMKLYQIVVLYGGLEDFINTIRLIGSTRITAPMNQSPKEKTS